MTWQKVKNIVRAVLWPPLILIAILSSYNFYSYITHSFRVKSLPIVFYINKAQPAEGLASAMVAAELWNNAMGKDIIKVVQTDSPLLTHNGWKNNRNDIVFVNARQYEYSEGLLGVALTDHSIREPGIITEGDIMIVDFIRSFSLSETCYKHSEVEKQDLIAVLVHEMGHVLGLGHIVGMPSIMRPYISESLDDLLRSGKYFTLEHAKPKRIDIEKIKKKYPEYFNEKKN